MRRTAMAIWLGLSLGLMASVASGQPLVPEEDLPAEVLRAQALEAPGEVVERGSFVMTFGEQRIGREWFVISQSARGWHVRAWVEPEGAGEPFRMAINYDQQIDFRNAEWETYGERRIEARYGIAEDKSSIIMHRRIGGRTGTPETFRVPDGDWWVSGPALSGDFGLLARQSLSVGDSESLTQLSFGTGGSPRMSRSSYRITREDDAEGGDDRRRYSFVQSAGGMSLAGEIVADALGAPLRVTLRVNEGEIVAKRVRFEEEKGE